VALEDELPIEQILLYRAHARAIHVRGGTTMPNSDSRSPRGGGTRRSLLTSTKLA
jgi:hypothetical protein